MLPGSQINKLAEAMWLGSPFIIKPTKEQSGGSLGTLLASSGVHLLYKALTSNVMQSYSRCTPPPPRPPKLDGSGMQLRTFN